MVWKSAIADESQDEYSIKNVVEKKAGRLSGWAIDERDPKPLARQAVFLAEKPFDTAADNVLIITMKHQMRHASRNIGRFRISVTSIAEPSFIAKIPATVRPLLDIPDTQRTQEQKEKLAAAYRDVSPLLDPTRKQIETFEGRSGETRHCNRDGDARTVRV